MDINIIINTKIYQTYKDDIILLNPRLFCNPNFYTIKTYTIPNDLTGISSYLKYVDVIYLHSLSTFIDFVNILLVLSYLKQNNYQGQVIIKYYLLNNNNFKKAVFVNTSLTNSDYNNVDEIINAIKVENSISNIMLKLPGFINYINFYNMIIDKEKFIFSINDIIEEYEEDIDLISSYLEEKYSNMGLNKQFYLDILKKYY